MKRAIVLLAFLACGDEAIVAPPAGPPVSIDVTLGARRSGSSCVFTFTAVSSPASVSVGYELTRSGVVFGRGSFSGRLEERWQSTAVSGSVEFVFTVGAWTKAGGIGASC